MKLVLISILLFCIIFALAVPMKMQNDKLAFLISQEKSFEDSVLSVRHDLSLVEKSLDSLSSRGRIDSAGLKLGLGIYGVATKITRYSK
jgi:hypothetical protein